MAQITNDWLIALDNKKLAVLLDFSSVFDLISLQSKLLCYGLSCIHKCEEDLIISFTPISPGIIQFCVGWGSL